MVISVRCEAEGYTNRAIQQAVDECAAKGGGTAKVPAGVYHLHDAVHLRNGVRLVGEDGAVLLKAPSIQGAVLDYLGYGFYEFTLKDPGSFEPGMGVHICDDNSGGFYDTVATIVARSGNTFLIDRMLNHDYDPGHNARVTTLFPLVEATGVHDAAVENVTLDGNVQEARTLNGCRGGGVFFIRSRAMGVKGVEVRSWHGDGISFQQCADVRVTGCRVHHNTGHGLHPGSGSVRYVLQNNQVSDNGGCGLYYCLRTTHSICADNRFERNGDAGISIGERDTDHLIRGNTIRGNGSGICFRRPLACGGDRVVIQDNTLGPNGGEKAQAEIIVPERLHDVYVAHNRFAAGAHAPLSVGTGCERITFYGNRVGDRTQAASDTEGETGAVRTSNGGPVPEVGPAALPLDGARHLDIARLPPWSGEDGARPG